MTNRSTTVRGSTKAIGASSGGELVLGRYRLHRRLGTGGFGTVWLARDERLERDVAVKVLPRERVMGGRFEREARAAARLSHPAIVTLYEAAVDDDGAYLVSELVRGATLAELLEAGRLSDRDVVSIGIEICDALTHAHAEGVVHRDVKPSNVLVRERSAENLAKLTDFGVARVIGGDSLTRTGDVVGTAAYMAPEQAEGREAGAAADLYSLALVLYEALTGVNPLRTGTPAQRARRLGAHLPPLRRQRRDLPRELGRSIDQALRPRSNERGTVEDLRAALVSSLGELQDRTGVVTGPWDRETNPSVSTPRKQKDSAPASVVPELSVPPRPAITWPARALGATVAAGLAAWLAAAPLTSAAVAPAVAAVAAGLAVLVLPRLGWLALAVATAGWLAGEGAGGAAFAILLGALLPVVLLFRHPARWPLAAIAPALALAGLAGAWPAIAARAPSAWQRAALAITGWIWLVLAAPLAGIEPYVRAAPGVPSRSVWMGSPYDAVNHLLSPLLRSGVLAPALVWAVAAVVLPPIVRSRPLSTRIVIVTAWSVGLLAGTAVVFAALQPAGTLTLGTAVLGAVAAGVAAMIPEGRRHRAGAAAVPATDPGLA